MGIEEPFGFVGEDQGVLAEEARALASERLSETRRELEHALARIVVVYGHPVEPGPEVPLHGVQHAAGVVRQVGDLAEVQRRGGGRLDSSSLMTLLSAE